MAMSQKDDLARQVTLIM